MLNLLPGEHVCKLALSPDDIRLVTSTDAGHVQIWNLASGKATPVAIGSHAGLRWAPLFTTDGKSIVLYEIYATELYVVDAATA